MGKVFGIYFTLFFREGILFFDLWTGILFSRLFSLGRFGCIVYFIGIWIK